jgi:hypothetical protein
MLGAVPAPIRLVILSEAKDLCTSPAAQMHRSLAAKNAAQDEKGGSTWLELRGLVPLLAKVPPCRIYRHDKRNLLDTQPALDSLFALDRVANVFEAFEVHQTVDFVFRGETGACTSFMFPHLRIRLFVSPCKAFWTGSS